MKCIECKKELSPLDLKISMDLFRVAVCMRHQTRMRKLIKKHQTPLEAVQLYYGLKSAGLAPMLQWWNGKKMVDIAFSRVKLNIEIDRGYEMMTPEHAIDRLGSEMISCNAGFTTIKVPRILVRHYLEDTAKQIQGMIEDLRATSRAI